MRPNDYGGRDMLAALRLCEQLDDNQNACIFFSEVRERLYSDKEINQGMSDEKGGGGGGMIDDGGDKQTDRI